MDSAIPEHVVQPSAGSTAVLQRIPRRRRWWPWILGFVLILLVAAAGFVRLILEKADLYPSDTGRWIPTPIAGCVSLSFKEETTRAQAAQAFVDAGLPVPPEVNEPPKNLGFLIPTFAVSTDDPAGVAVDVLRDPRVIGAIDQHFNFPYTEDWLLIVLFRDDVPVGEARKFLTEEKGYHLTTEGAKFSALQITVTVGQEGRYIDSSLGRSPFIIYVRQCMKLPPAIPL